MAGRFEGVSDLGVALVRGHFSPSTAQTQSWDAACAVSENIEYLALYLNYRVSLV